MRNAIGRASRIVAITIVAFLPVNGASADDAVPWKQLSAQWWQWVLSIPTSVNPLIDPTGGNCMVGQRGTTWFLAGTFGGGPVVRECDVPEGTTLFFPVINSINIDTPGQCGQGDPVPVSVYRDLSEQFLNGATNLSVTLDGDPVSPLHRTASPVFAVAVPADNLFSFCLPAGIYSPAVDAGIYARLNPLSVGTHTLHIHAENPGAGFELDVTYHLNVVPVVLR
jgi:hypothetical protein